MKDRAGSRARLRLRVWQKETEVVGVKTMIRFLRGAENRILW